MTDIKSVAIKTEGDLKLFLANNYMTQIKNLLGDEKRAMRFLSSIMASVQKTPDLLNCEPSSLINSFMTMAQLNLMPSNVSGEAYVLPYNTRDGKVAQFQLGYQGLITLFYRAGVQSIRSEIVRDKDVFTISNGLIQHDIDPRLSINDRGDAIGAYAIAIVNGQPVSKYMNSKDILKMGKDFSKSFNSAYSPWKETADPELWMWKKTVIKQLAKLLPKNETIFNAIDADNDADGILPKPDTMVDTSGLTMGSFVKKPTEPTYVEDSQDATSEEGKA